MSDSKRVAEGKGFEPSKGVAALNGLASRHPSTCKGGESGGTPQETAISEEREERRSREHERSASAQKGAQSGASLKSYDLWRFISKVDVGALTACWPWRGGTSEQGYGRFKIGTRLYLPHRIAYEILNGPIPEGEGYHGTVVRHRCDNPACCNPYHLVIGSQSDNVRDMFERGREGDRRRSRLDPDLVERIMRDPRPHRVIAADLGVAASYVGKIKRGEALKWLLEEQEAS